MPPDARPRRGRRIAKLVAQAIGRRRGGRAQGQGYDQRGASKAR